MSEDRDGNEENQGSLSRRQFSGYSNQIHPEGVSELCVISFVFHSVQSDLLLCSGTYAYL